jgi:hypothetical protein
MGRLAATEPVVWTLQDHFWTHSKSLKGAHRFRDVRSRRVIVRQRRSSPAQLHSAWRDPAHYAERVNRATLRADPLAQ